ncbi:MAG: hypothetical protein R2756_07940 [Bacteroidales bacterium]
MHTFALKRIEQIKGKISFFKLEIDGVCEFDEFCETLEKKKEGSKLRTIYAIMESASNITPSRLPGTKYKELAGRPQGDDVKEYEIKKKPYRVYLFRDDEGNIIAFGGIKNNQKKDITRFRSIKKEYLLSKAK